MKKTLKFDENVKAESIKELKDLDGKIERLTNFLNQSFADDEYAATQVMWMSKQLNAMKHYRSALDERIKAMK